MKKRASFLTRIAVLAAVGAGIGSCGGGPGAPALVVLGFNFAPGFAGVRINAPIELTFSAAVDPASVTADAVRVFTTTTTTNQPDPGAPAIFDAAIVIGNVVILKPRIPQTRDLSDAGLRIGFTYTVQVPASPAVIEPIRSVAGDPNLESFVEFFTTINSTVLPAPGDNLAEPNLASLNLFFIDEFDETNSLGVDPCPRNLLPVADRDSPQVINTDPDEGEQGFGTITGIQAGLGTAFVRLDPLTIDFSEPIGPWRIRAANITIRNTNLGGETFDLFFFFTQDRTHSRLQITVFDADSAFDQASVPQGTYVLRLTEFTDLAGNLLVNTATCSANPNDGGGTFELTFSTASSPALPTDFTLTFGDADGDGHTDIGGITDPNIFPEFMAPFLGGMSVDTVANPSTSLVHTSANWGDTAIWSGCEVFYANGLDPVTLNDLNISANIRLRGGSRTAATAIMAPIAGRASGASPGGSPDAGVPRPDGKVDFFATGGVTVELFTGDLDTGPLVYHYARFDLIQDATGARPTLTYRKIDDDDSVFPMIIFAEEEAVISGVIDLDGGDGQLGFNGMNTGVPHPSGRNPGGLGGIAGAGGGHGGNGGAAILGNPDPEFLNGQTGEVPANVIGPLDQLSEAMAGILGMATGGGGHYDNAQDEDNMEGPDSDGTGPDMDGIFVPAYQGGGGASQSTGGTAGADREFVTPGASDQGAGGQRFGSDPNIQERPFQGPVLCSGGAGGGGGAADDDGMGGGQLFDDNGAADTTDDGGGGAGAGGGFLGLACAGDIVLGEFAGAIVRFATIRCVGGRGGSTYAFAEGTPPQPALWTDADGDEEVDPGELSSPDISGQVGQGEAGGGGGAGNICLIAGGQIIPNAVEIYAFGKRGGNAPSIEGGGRGSQGEPIEGGAGGGGVIVLADPDGLTLVELPAQAGGTNTLFMFGPDPQRDVDGNGDFDLFDPGPDGVEGTPDDVVAPGPDPATGGDPAEILHDFSEMSGGAILIADVYGDDTREPLFGTTRIVTEFLDTLTDFGSYNEIRTLSNAPRFPDGTIRVFLDATQVAAGGLPDLSTEAADGTILPPVGGTEEGALNANPFPVGHPLNPDGLAIGDQTDNMGNPLPTLFESRFRGIPAASDTLGRRFVRGRIVFDLSLIGGPAALLASFAPPDAELIAVADDPGTAPPLIENTLGNQETAPEGVPAVTEFRINFTPAGNPN